ncbi:histone H2B 1/2-like [Spea bombifrons]|uniref:histone H2B 1/2-like n=1 Tax=Spea bombifrons TaxID=233779 RepID=UPI002349BEB7|nr:histone H2B 1/2-like [Spea bombifrons]
MKAVGVGGKKRPLKAAGKEKSKKEYSKRVYRVLKQVHPDQSRYQKAVELLNGDLVKGDGLAGVAEEAARLSHYNPRKTITSCEIQSALGAQGGGR